MDDLPSVEDLCARLAEMTDVFLPIRNQSEDNKEAEWTPERRSIELQDYFKRSPMKFLQRYHIHIKPSELSCFNALPKNDQVGYYIKKICHQQDLESRIELDGHYISHEVKNRRYRALQKLIKEGEYFSEEEMKKRSPALYEYYIGRFLTTEEKEEKLRARAAAPPVSLSEFFMEVIERKQDLEEMEKEEEEFDEDSEEDKEEDTTPEIPNEEKEYLAKEFESRMYQHFLDGLDKNFSYESVDENTEYDDLTQIGRDVEDNYFDEEEPSDIKDDSGKWNVEAQVEENDSEDELDKYMKTMENRKQDNPDQLSGGSSTDKETMVKTEEIVT